MPKPKAVEKSHCNECGHETKHSVVAKRVFEGSDVFDEEFGLSVDWTTTYTMLECLGCESVTLRKVAWFSEWESSVVTYYPPAISRNLPTWMDKLPDGEKELLKELHTALHANSPRLAIMGARALVDMLMTREVGDIGGFSTKIKELKKKGIISEVNAEILDAALEMGHAAAHRGHKPKPVEVSQVIDIVENILHTSILKEEVKALKANTPQRKPQPKP